MATKKQIIDLQKELLEKTITFLKSKGISTSKLANEFRVKKVIEEPLWKIPEIHGKTYPRFLSEDVYKTWKKLSDNNINNRNRTSVWTNDQIINALEQGVVLLSKDPDYFKVQLEHVTEKKILVEMLLDKGMNIHDVIDNYNLGCAVLKHEHHRLRDDHFDPKDVWSRYRDRVKVYDRFKDEWVV